MYRVYLFVIGICICCPLIGAKEPLHLLADPTPTVTSGYEAGALTGYFAGDRKQTGLFFSYESSMLKEFRHVSLTARDESLSYCLKRLFEPLPLVYRITGRYVIFETETPAIYHQWVCAGFRILRESDCGDRSGTFFRKKDRFPIITVFTVLPCLRGK